jgi:hypothetical protein
VDETCQENITRCTNNVCDTTKNRFNSKDYKPEIKIEPPPVELTNIPEIFNFSQFPLIDNEAPFDSSGLIDLVSNTKNFTYYWSNSKYVNKKCINNVCTITTKTCVNGNCNEKVDTETF